MLSLDADVDEDALGLQIESVGGQLLYSTEDDEGVCHVVAHLPLTVPDSGLLIGIKSFEKQTLPDVDWEAQWQAFAPGYAEDGLQHLTIAGTELRLRPGPGFGDCSHPTTCLMLEAMEHSCEGKRVLDLGTGSGILAFAAAVHGAKRVLGTEICDDALAHAEANLALNPDLVSVSFQHSSEELRGVEWDLVLMNMISSEQDAVWQAVGQHLAGVERIILSGVRCEEERELIELWAGRGYRLYHSHASDGWVLLAFMTRQE
jgi:ribosomal protein L11 methyltransferase